MKTLMLTMALLCLCMYTATALDTLLLMNGDDLYVKVEKIDGATISYTIPPDTTLFTLNKEEVFMVKFATGTRYTIAKTQTKEESKQELEEAVKKKKALMDYEKYNSSYNRRKTTGIALLSTGGTLVTLGGILLAVYIPASKENIPYNSSYLGIIGACFAIGASTPFLISGTCVLVSLPKHKRKMNEAKQQLTFAPVTQPLQPVGNIGGSYSGVAMRFNF